MQLDELELGLEPVFEIGDKVRLRKLIKNDGTFPGLEIGTVLAKKGDIGYVVSVGTFLQDLHLCRSFSSNYGVCRRLSQR